MEPKRTLWVLDQDHERIEALLTSVSDPAVDRGKVLREIVERISAHISVEQAIFFPALARGGVVEVDVLDALKDDYRQMERSLLLIDRRKVNSPDTPSLVTELADRFAEHLRLFGEKIEPQCIGALSSEEIDNLNSQMMSADNVILSHPHPHMLSLGPVSRFTTRIAARLDRLRDRTVNNRLTPTGRPSKKA